MDYLQQLLNNQPVEWKKLGEVCDVLRGKRLTKSQLSQENNGYAVYHGGIVPIGYYHSPNRNADSTMVINVGASAGTVGYSKEKFWSSDGCFCFSDSPILLQRFLFYYLQSIEHKIKSKVRVAGIPTLDASVLSKLPLPIPPLSVQSRIVEILDKFTAMEAELQAELELRKKQYIYYRELLLLKNPLCKPVPLGWLGEVRMCKRILKNQTTEEGDIPFYKIGTFGKQADAYISRPLYEEFRSKYPYPSKGDMLISASGTIGRVIEFDGEDAYFQDSNIVWLEHDGTRVINRYLYHCYQIADWKVAKGGTITRLYNDNFKKTEIPIPPLSEQARIVEMLDKFDALINSISEGLPLEIQLRRQQYEYYREQLLDFRR